MLWSVLTPSTVREWCLIRAVQPHLIRCFKSTEEPDGVDDILHILHGRVLSNRQRANCLDVNLFIAAPKFAEVAAAEHLVAHAPMDIEDTGSHCFNAFRPTHA